MKNGTQIHQYTLFLALLLILAGCKKYEDVAGPHTDPRFERKYCNVPEAVNYNRDFPGTPDNTDAVCIYPTDIFKGRFLFTDSIYNEANLFLRQEEKLLNMLALSRTKLAVAGFCPSSSLTFTANRNQRADADSTFTNGQSLCRPTDTLTGYIFRGVDDSTHLQFEWRVASDTGVFFHRGTAVKQ